MSDEKHQVPNSADPATVRKESKKEQLARQQLMHDYKTVLALPEGRRLIWDLMGFCYLFRDMQGNNADVNRALGRRKVGLRLISNVNQADPDRYIEMQVEARKQKDLGK